MANTRGARGQYHCSFCGKSQDQVRRLIAGPGAVYICDECVDLCREIIDEESAPPTKAKVPLAKLPTPKKIYEQLNAYVVGQERAKKVLSVAVYNHYKRVSAGMQVEDVENILLRLIQAADFDIARAERGIVYIDEIDKIARKGDNPSITRDVSGEGVQQGMLKLLEGTDVLVPPQGGRKHPEQKLIKINTQNILFICGGAFDGIDKIIARRVQTNTIGFNVDKALQENMKKNLLRYVNAQDLKGFGLIPELLGRLPVVTHLDPLDAVTLRAILTEPKNALIKQYVRLFELEGIKLTIEEDVMDFMVEKAMEYKLGARGLRSICEGILTDAMFELPSSKEKYFNLSMEYAQRKFDKSKLSLLKVA